MAVRGILPALRPMSEAAANLASSGARGRRSLGAVLVKMFRYRKPSLNQLLGITAAKRRVKRELGISQVQAWTKPSRVKQRVKQQIGLYSPVARAVRQTAKGRFPSFLGLFGRRR